MSTVASIEDFGQTPILPTKISPAWGVRVAAARAADKPLLPFYRRAIKPAIRGWAFGRRGAAEGAIPTRQSPEWEEHLRYAVAGISEIMPDEVVVEDELRMAETALPTKITPEWQRFVDRQLEEPMGNVLTIGDLSQNGANGRVPEITEGVSTLGKVVVYGGLAALAGWALGII